VRQQATSHAFWYVFSIDVPRQHDFATSVRYDDMTAVAREMLPALIQRVRHEQHDTRKEMRECVGNSAAFTARWTL
jgi:hypothetical protein